MDKWGAPAQTSVLHFGFALWRRKTLHFNTSLSHWRRITLYKKHSGRGDPSKYIDEKNVIETEIDSQKQRIELLERNNLDQEKKDMWDD